ncbi:hypothetical protein K4V17_09915 [Staphylococcus epidermidis]|nr:hypothetical protein [Staphylococcus epidermidis]
MIKMMSSTGTYVPPDVSTVKTLNKVSQIIALILGIILIILGALSLIIIVGIVPLIFGIIDLLIFYEIREIDSLIDLQRYNDAKNKTFVWMIIGFILSGVIVGIILLIAWIKYDDIIRAVQQSYMQQGPVPPTPPPQ